METTSPLPININDKDRLFHLLSALQPHTSAVFGIMTPQHMVEHLILSLQFSNGKKTQHLHYSVEQAAKVKSFILYSKEELPMGFKSPIVPTDALLPLELSNLQQAVENLKTELYDFNNYFKLNPTAAPIHPITGELTHAEWITFHNKHFLHHFRQFGLI